MHTLSIDGQVYLPATKTDLSTLRGVVYAIRNRYDGKVYVGKTTQTFTKRYGGYGWWKSTVNILLQRVFRLTSHVEFDVFILRAGLTSKMTLNDAEKHCATALNAYAPHGYNVRECGEEGGYHGGEITVKIEAARAASRKTYRVRRLDTNEIITVTHVRQWCKDNGIREMAFRNLLCGLVLASQGFCREETTREDVKQAQERVRQKAARTFEIKRISTGEVLRFHNAARFCVDNDLGYAAFKTMLTGKSRSSQGFCLPDTVFPTKRLYQVTSPTGETLQFDSIAEFDREHGLDLQGMRQRWQKRNREGWSNLIVVREGTVVHVPRNATRPTPTGLLPHST